MFRRLIFISMALLFCITTSAFSQEKFKVVTTLSTFADLAKQIGGDYVEVYSISPGKFNPHFYEPKPSDVLKTQRADLFVHAGLDLELWRYPLVEAAGNPDILPGGKKELAMSDGIRLVEIPQGFSRLQGDIHVYGNPHYWVDPRNGKIMAENIARKLKAIDPVHSNEYDKNLKAFLEKLNERIAVWQEELKAVKGKELVAYHNEWVYFTEFCGLSLNQYLEPKPGIPPTQRQISFIERYIKENNVKAIVQPTYFPRGYSDTLAKLTKSRVVILAQNTGEVKGTDDYFSLFDFNVREITKALE